MQQKPLRRRPAPGGTERHPAPDGRLQPAGRRQSASSHGSAALVETGRPGKPLPLKEFRRNLRMLEREVELAMASDTGCCGVSLAQCHILLEVESRGTTSVTGLASALELDKSTLSRAVDVMCRRGWLDRATDSENRRQQIITLTAGGREKAASINKMCDASYGRLFACIPPARWKSVVESVELLAGAMRGVRKSGGSACSEPLPAAPVAYESRAARVAVRGVPRAALKT